MYQNFISRHFSNQSGITEFLLIGHVPIAEFSNWLRRVIWGRILRGRHHGTRLWNSVDAKWLWRIKPVEWPSWTWCRKWWNHSWHSSLVTLNQRCFAFIRLHTPLVYSYHVISRTQSHSVVFGCTPSGWMPGAPIARRHLVTLLTVEQLLYWSDWICTGRTAQIEAKQSLDSGI